jgi:hypothetical protein
MKSYDPEARHRADIALLLSIVAITLALISLTR